MRGLTLHARGRARLLGGRRLPQLRRPVARAALLEATELATPAADCAGATRPSREVRDETPHARTIVFDVPGWPGHRAGQHVDVRLTAEDGYQAERSYSIASAPEDAHARADGRADRGRRGLARTWSSELRAGDQLRAARPDRRPLHLVRRATAGRCC